jgi:hypothetical protein
VAVLFDVSLATITRSLKLRCQTGQLDPKPSGLVLSALEADYLQHLTEALGAGRRGDAVALFIRYTGMPRDQIETMRQSPAERHCTGADTQEKGTEMKYMILTYASQQDYDAMAGKPGSRSAWSPEDFAAMGAFNGVLTKDLIQSGELVDTRGLSAPVHSRRVQLQKGVPVVTDGPYVETTEILAGYWIVECESFDRATEIAARPASCPAPAGVAEGAYADVRPIAESRDELDL